MLGFGQKHKKGVFGSDSAVHKGHLFVLGLGAGNLARPESRRLLQGNVSIRRSPSLAEPRGPLPMGEMQGALARARLESLLRPRHKKRAEAQKRSESFLLSGLGKRRRPSHGGTRLLRWSCSAPARFAGFNEGLGTRSGSPGGGSQAPGPHSARTDPGAPSRRHSSSNSGRAAPRGQGWEAAVGRLEAWAGGYAARGKQQGGRDQVPSHPGYRVALLSSSPRVINGKNGKLPQALQPSPPPPPSLSPPDAKADNRPAPGPPRTVRVLLAPARGSAARRGPYRPPPAAAPPARRGAAGAGPGRGLPALLPHCRSGPAPEPRHSI